MIPRPDESELELPYRTSLRQVPRGDVLTILAEQMIDTAGLLSVIDDARARHRYAPRKWSVKEVVGHVIDTERIMSYRALAFARGEAAPLPGYEQDDYVLAGRFDERTIESLVAELESVRAATLALFGGLDPEALTRVGVASGARFTVRALAFLICGHEIHHKQLLRERYGL